MANVLTNDAAMVSFLLVLRSHEYRYVDISVDALQLERGANVKHPPTLALP